MLKFLIVGFLCFMAYCFWLGMVAIRRKHHPEPGKRLTLANGLIPRQREEEEEDWRYQKWS